MIEISAVRSVTMLVGIHMRSNLYSMESKFRAAALEFSCRKLRVLQGNGAQTHKVGRVITNHRRDVVIQDAAKIQTVARFRPVTEHHRHGGKHLHRYAGPLHVLDPTFGIPRVIADFAKHVVAFHHPGATRLVMVEPDKPGIAVLLVQVRPFVWQDVGMEVDLHQRWSKRPTLNAQRPTLKSEPLSRW